MSLSHNHSYDYHANQHQDRLYYYETDRGQAGERGSGLIELKYFIDCVEAPLTDHKKATNVFLLLAAERGFFDQGRCYLSAETLIDMKDWVTRIRSALEGLQHQGDKEQTAVDSGPTSLPSEVSRAPTTTTRRDTIIPEPLYASIREESIHRSNIININIINIITSTGRTASPHFPACAETTSGRATIGTTGPWTRGRCAVLGELTTTSPITTLPQR